MKRTFNSFLFMFMAIFMMAMISFSSLKAYAEDEHTYSEDQVEYQWNFDHSKCQAVFTCETCGEVTTLDCLVTIEAYILPTETENGTAEYTATVELNNKKYVHQFYQKDIPCTGKKENTSVVTPVTPVQPEKVTVEENHQHAFTEAEYTWNYDHSKCDVSLRCESCKVTISSPCTIDMSVYTWPTVDTLGATKYTATAKVSGKTYEEVLIQKDIPATERILALAKDAKENHPFDDSKADENGRIIEKYQDGKLVMSSDSKKDETSPEKEPEKDTEVEDEETTPIDTEDHDDVETETVEEETTIEESTVEETTVEDTTVKETEESASESEESVSESESESETEETTEEMTVEETESAEEVTTEDMTEEVSESETTVEETKEPVIPKPDKTASIPFWIWIIIGLVAVIIALVIIIIVNNRRNMTKRKNLRKKINDELK